MPVHRKTDSAIEFVLQNKEWLQKHLKTIKRIESKKHFLQEGKISRNYLLFLKPDSSNKIHISRNQQTLILHHPPSLKLEDEEIQKAIRYCSEWAYKHEAKQYLPKRTQELASKHGFTFSKVGISSAKTRWGSCSSGNSINLSFFLMTLPDHLIDYVILHELVHTVHKNHSPRFWNLLEKVCPDSYKHKLEIKRHRTEV